MNLAFSHAPLAPLAFLRNFFSCFRRIFLSSESANHEYSSRVEVHKENRAAMPKRWANRTQTRRMFWEDNLFDGFDPWESPPCKLKRVHILIEAPSFSVSHSRYKGGFLVSMLHHCKESHITMLDSWYLLEYGHVYSVRIYWGDPAPPQKDFLWRFCLRCNSIYKRFFLLLWKEESSRNVGKVTQAVAASQVYKDALAPSFNTSIPHTTLTL
jgi:hypothetical protein